MKSKPFAPAPPCLSSAHICPCLKFYPLLSGPALILLVYHRVLFRLQSNGQVRSEGAPEFPGKRVVTEESFKGDRADVSSDFVRQRKEQLGSFLRQLFNKNPGNKKNGSLRGGVEAVLLKMKNSSFTSIIRHRKNASCHLRGDRNENPLYLQPCFSWSLIQKVAPCFCF